MTVEPVNLQLYQKPSCPLRQLLKSRSLELAVFLVHLPLKIQISYSYSLDDSIELRWMSPEEQGPVPMQGYIVQFQLLNPEQAAG